MRRALHPSLDKGIRFSVERRIYFAFGLGMVLNALSIYIGNPYVVSGLMIPVAILLTFKWSNYPLPWIVLVSVVAANPVNLNASIALNLVFALFFVILNTNYAKRLPAWLYPTLFFSLLSVLGSVTNWTAGNFLTQLASVGNYVVGPFYLIPMIYMRLRNENNHNLLLKCYFLSLILPSIITMLLARSFGTPRVDQPVHLLEALVNVSVYRIGNIDVYLTRTQAGILLASLICATFAISIVAESKKLRMAALASLCASIFLLLVTGSVGSSLAAICSIFLLLYVARRFIPVRKYIIIFPLFIILSYVGWTQLPIVVKDYVKLRYEEKLATGIDTSDRSDRWRASLEYLLTNPEGRGWELYVEPIRTYPHNDYLSYGIAFGLVSGLIYLFVPFKIMFSKIIFKPQLKSPAQVALLLAGIGAVSVLIVNAFADHLIPNRWYFNVLWSMIWFSYFSIQANRSRSQEIRINERTD